MYKTTLELTQMSAEEIARYIDYLEKNDPIAKENGKEYVEWCMWDLENAFEKMGISNDEFDVVSEKVAQEDMKNNKEVNKIWSDINDKYSDMIFSLYERWQDEKEYENIQDYLPVIQKIIPSAYEMTNKPFGFKAKADDMNILISVKFNGNELQLFCDKVVG